MSMDKVRVAVRVRPMNRREHDLTTKIVVDMKENQTVLYHPSSPLDGSGTGTRKQPKTFAFDNCFWSMDEKDPKFAAQDHVFNCLGKDLLEKAYEGYNGCIFAYGQTGSGKSYTMMGTFEDTGKGIIPRLCDAMFEHIAVQKSPATGFKVEVSYMEIYNEKVHDLLDPKGSKQNLKVREHNILGPYVDGLSMLAVSSFEDIDKLMSEGNKSRTVAATNMNNESSRSHAVFNIVLTQILTDLSSGISGEKVSKISLVDLAGSERAQKTGAVGDRLREGSNINKSLTTLGLVISALADQTAEKKKKEKFVPYRDSVLTWLLKDNLGGNSKTVMVATISPAADNYEETLSTLRYADRAKRIVNHAVINEDPNARIIRDLRDEVDVLKKQLSDAQNNQAPVLQDRLQESEKLIKEMTKTWEEKLSETERIHQERHEALEKMGVSVQTSGIKVETGKHYLVNLNADPSLNELLVYYLKDHTLVGRPDAATQQDIQLSGLGIMSEHCVVDIENSDLYITPLEGARTCVNGSIIHQKTRVKQGDRILWGNNHFFRINCPKKLNSPQSNEPEEQIDYNFAQHEYMMKECSGDPIQEAILGLEKQYEEDKQEALEKQRQEYEKQMQMLRNQIMSPGTPSTHFLNMNNFTPTGIGSQGTIQRKYQRWAQEKEKNFKQSLQVLREEVLKANALVREANVLAQEMGKRTEFQVTLQIPASNLSPNRRRGAFVSEPALLVKRKNRPSQIWSMEKFENKIIDMRELYEEQKSSGKPMMVEDTDPETDSWDDGPYMKGDPFYESQENHNLIGVANIFLQCLFHDVKLRYHVPIISQQGEIAGKLHMEISKLGGSFLDRYADTSDDTYDDDSPVMANSPMIVRVCIKEAKGLPISLSNFVFCQYTFWGQEESTIVPPLINPDSCETRNNSDSLNVKFNHSKDFKVYTSEEFIEHCQEGALSLEVWGHRITSAGNSVADITKTVSAKTRSLTDRWNEVMRKIELWAEIHEINHQGEWCPVEVQPKQEVLSAGVFQLQQGHSRRVVVKVKPAADSGTLPLICESLVSVSVGCIYSRSKLQKGLDSYQEEDLQRLRDRWSDALQKRKEYLHEQIQKLINKQDKSEADSDRERALMDQWVCLTEERNAVMVPAPGSGIPGTPADKEPPAYMEKHMPVLFLDLNADDMSTPNAKEGYQAAGINSILPKEHASTFVSLPLIKSYMEKDTICAVASWDASMHDSVHLNRVTSSSDRVYMILKAVVRLSHPAAMELVLRKRICINIYNSLSFTNLTGKLRQKITGMEKFYDSGITYEVVSNIPKASEDLENMETLAQMAASQNDTNAADGETYIEKYIKGVSAVESILLLDRLRQEVAVKELSAHQGKQLYKTTSTPNIHQSLTSPTQDGQHLRADSIQDLSHDLSLSPSRFGSPARPNFLNLRSIGLTQPMSKTALSPLGTKMAMKTMSTLIEEQHKREMKPLLRRDTEEEFDEVEYEKAPTKVEDDPQSVGSEEFQDFESYQSQQPTQTQKTSGDGIVHSNTNDSLTEIQNKNFTPSLVSSGYGSQAVSMLTLSSEDSLSLRSMDDNTDGHREGRGGQKGSLEQTSSESDADDNKEDRDVSKRKSPDSEFEDNDCNNSGEITVDEKENEEKFKLSDNTEEENIAEEGVNDGILEEIVNTSQTEESDPGADLSVSGASVEALNGSLDTKPDPDSSYIDGIKPVESEKEHKAMESGNISQNSTDVICSERLRKSKEERQKILESLRDPKMDKIEKKEKLKTNKNVKRNTSQGASAINDFVDPYSETAMEELEKLGIHEEEEFIDEDVTKAENGGNNNLVITEEKDSKLKNNSSKNIVNVRTRDLLNNKSSESPPKLREKTPGNAGRQRPVSCIVSPSQNISNLLDESMKRNSLTLHLSDEDMSGGDDSLSVCSFGSRADLDRLQEVPIPSWIQIGESVMVSSSKGGTKTGVVHFVGNVEFANGPWVGVALDLPEGKNDGSVNGIRYFKCRSRHGIFVRHDKLILDKKRRGSRKQAKESTKRHSMSSSASGTGHVRSPNSHISSPNSSLMKPTAASSAKKK